jgi:hypothetical protein
MKITTTLSLSFLLGTSYLPGAMAQQTTGTPGSPSATITIDGKQLPPPPPKFGGVIKESAKDSEPWWPPRVVPPKGAPNVLLIMTDDQGYGVSGTFGGVIPTPALDRVANTGLRFTQFCSTALCSPTRAALITGRSGPNSLPICFFDWPDLRTVTFALETTCGTREPIRLKTGILPNAHEAPYSLLCWLLLARLDGKPSSISLPIHCSKT